jgi:holo-[acyl-carrier protein] synthase
MSLMDAVSIGVDIVSVNRISKNIDDNKDIFINRVYTKDEIEYCKSKKNYFERFAGRLAGKEAVSKALKMTWEQGINWKDIEILNSTNDIPKVILHGHAKRIASELNIKDIQISISHENDYAVAFVILLEGKEK